MLARKQHDDSYIYYEVYYSNTRIIITTLTVFPVDLVPAEITIPKFTTSSTNRIVVIWNVQLNTSQVFMSNIMALHASGWWPYNDW